MEFLAFQAVGASSGDTPLSFGSGVSWRKNGSHLGLGTASSFSTFQLAKMYFAVARYGSSRRLFLPRAMKKV